MELLDDSPVVPGDTRASYEHGAQARQILNDAEDDLRDWQPEAEQYSSIGRVDSETTRATEALTLEDGRDTRAAPIDSKPAEAAGALPGDRGSKMEEAL